MDSFVEKDQDHAPVGDLASTEIRRQRPSIVEWKLESRSDSVGIEATISCGGGCGCA